MSDWLALFADHTVQNVVLGATFLGVTSGVLGSFAVLRQQSLLGDTLAHAALPGVCLGFIVAGGRDLGFILAGALATAVLAALVMLLLTRRSRLKTDAALGAALSFAFAVGVVLLTYIQNTASAAQGGLESFLFGQAAATLRSDLWIMGGIMAGALALVAAFWKEFKLVTFDPLFAGAIGLPVTVLDVVLTTMIAFAVVIGLQMVGVVLMASMVIAPAVAARQWVTRLEHMVVLAAVTGVVAGVAGALVSAVGANLATGPLIVLAASALVVVSILTAPGRGVLWEQVARLRARRALRGRQVLTTLYELAEEHADPHYPAERGTLDTFHGLDTRAALGRLERRGLVERVDHMPDEGPHWELTDAGRREARRTRGEVEAEGRR
ncbi:MAG: metal ABC transporter permease [Alphaproteobacteria bacterium]